jgi:hypothetical protein
MALKDWFTHCQKTTPGVVLEGEEEDQLKSVAAYSSYTSAIITINMLVHYACLEGNLSFGRGVLYKENKQLIAQSSFSPFSL